MLIRKRDGHLEECDSSKIFKCVERACEGLADVSVDELVQEAELQLYDGMSTDEIDKATVLAARSRIISEPNYSYVAGRLLLNVLYKEVFNKGIVQETFAQDYRSSFVSNLYSLVEVSRISTELVSDKFNLTALALALKPERDFQFKYLGIQTLYDRYFQKIGERRMESPQAFWMRVAMGICLSEDNPTKSAIEAYELFSTFRYCPGTPTLFNAGTVHPQLSSCYLSTVDDSIDGIFGTIHGQARLSKYAGGLGVDWTPVRGLGSWIQGTNGPSQGLMPWLKIFNDTLVAVNQGSKRKGAGCSYLETWHLDILDFLELRKNTGDERRRTPDMNTANWIPDLFMKQVRADGEWYLFSPNEVADLHELYGEAFEKRYWEYVEQGKAGSLKSFESIKAKELWKKMLTAIYETGHPWITFKDPSNIRYPNQHAGVVHSSNLCCVTGDSRAATARGLIRVDELCKMGCANAVAGRGKIEVATAIELTIKDSPILKIVTEDGYEHKVTPDHPLWVVDTGWVEAQHLQVGNAIELQQTFHLFGGVDNVDDAFDDGLDNTKTTIPEFVWCGNEKTVNAYLQGVLHSRKIQQPKHRISFLKELQILLMNLGVKTTIGHLCLTQSGVDMFELSTVSLEDCLDNYTIVKSITIEPPEDVYCLMVDSEDRAWTCNGLLTKNTEILLHTTPSDYEEGKRIKVGETAVCNLGSVNLSAHLTEENEMDWGRLADTVQKAIRLLDNVIDINFYPTDEARQSNLMNRPVGLGQMGWADVLHMMQLDYDSAWAANFAGIVQEFISFHAIKASSNLAEERGSYPTYHGSSWSKGKLPIDSYVELMRVRGVEVNQYEECSMNWNILAELVKKQGMRNSNTMAIAPTATISYIVGCSQSTEPDFSVLFVYSTLSGEFTMLNEHFVRRMKELGLWNEKLIKQIQRNDGDVSGLDLPGEIKEEFKTAFGVGYKAIIDAAAERQKWVDQGMSTNLYSDKTSLKYLNDMYFYAFDKGLKTTYYLRTKAASKIEKSTVESEQVACSIEAAKNGEICDSCQ